MSFFLLPRSIFWTLYVRFGTLHGLYKLGLLLFNLSDLTYCARNCSVMISAPWLPMAQTHHSTVHSSFDSFPPRYICPHLSPQELFRYGFLPYGSIMLPNSPNAPLSPLIQTSLFRIFYSHTLCASECPKCTFFRRSPAFLDSHLFLPSLLATTSPPNSTSILSLRMHSLSERYSSLLSR